jgi:transposase
LSAGQSEDVKIFRAQLCVALKARGVPISTFLSAVGETDFKVAQRTLYDHVAAIERGEAPVSAENKSGRPTALSGEEWEIVCGAILCAEEKCDLAWVLAFAEASFSVEMSESTVTRYLREQRLTLQLVGTRPMPKGMLREKYVSIYYDFLLMLTNNGFFKGDPKGTYCIDSTTNSYRLERVKTYNIRGGKQKKVFVVQAGPYELLLGGFLFWRRNDATQR